MTSPKRTPDLVVLCSRKADTPRVAARVYAGVLVWNTTRATPNYLGAQWCATCARCALGGCSTFSARRADVAAVPTGGWPLRSCSVSLGARASPRAKWST